MIIFNKNKKIKSKMQINDLHHHVNQGFLSVKKNHSQNQTNCRKPFLISRDIY